MKVLALFESVVRLSVLLVTLMFLTVAGTAQAAKSITLAWSPSSDSIVTGYNIYYGVASSQYTNHVFVSGVSTTNATVNNLVDGVGYYFAAKSCDAAGNESVFSNEVNYQPVTTPAVAPSISWSQPADITYGTALSAAQLNATASVPGSFAYSPALNTILASGNGRVLTAVFTPTDTTKYTSVTNTVTINVNKASLTIAAGSKTKTYGAANPALTATYSGFVNGDTAASLSTAVSLATTATASSPVGAYAITASGATSSNYTITFVNGALTVTPAALTITADAKSKVFGAANPTLTASYSGFVNGDTAASLATPVSLATTATASSPIGTYPITASGASSPNYSIAYVNGSLNVTSAVLTITAEAKTMTYGSALPTFTATYSGFINGDTAASLTRQPTLTATATAGSPVGSYTITASGAVSSNYTIAYVAGTLTVTRAALTITADAKTKVYGAANPALTATYSGFVNGDTAASLSTAVSLATTATASSPVGAYAITASGATSSNYTITFMNGTLTVTPAALTITADAKSKVFGAANPTLTATYSGFVNGDTAASLTTPVSLATTATASSPIGTYPITASGASSPNYSIAYVNGSLNVTSAVLTITAEAKTMTYGSALPTFTATYSGFINGDTVASLTRQPTLTATATAGSPVGSYTITASGAVSSNYTIAYVAGTLTVTRAALTITADAKTKTYGAANPTLTATYSGFVNGDTAASLSTPVSLATTATASSPVGAYAITASGATSSNYTITFVNGALTVTPAALTITADAKTKTYGAANPTLTATYSGFVNGDTAASLPTPVSLGTAATTASHVGTYPIVANGAASPNYTITFVNNNLSVTPAALTITANNQSRVVNTANPTLTATYSGFVNGDTAASLTTQESLTTTATLSSPVGSYPITASGAQDADYAITHVNGTLTVTAATASLVSLVVTPSTTSVTVNQTAQFAAMGTYSDGTVSNLTASASWLSSATGVASVSGTGLATGLTAGSATITATVSGVSSSAALTVQSTSAASSTTFSSTRSMTIPSIGVASPYVTTINVSGLVGVISKVTVTLNGITHSWPHDINALLVGPSGQKVLLMRHAGGGYPVSNVDITLDDDAKNKLPNYSGLKTDTYKPTNYGTVYNFATPAPAIPYSSQLSAFSKTNPNGTWSLYVLDDASGDGGSMAGWTLNITTTTITPLNIVFSTSDEPVAQTDALAVKPAIATPPAVWIESISFNTNGQAALIMSGRPDAQYTVESTTDFVQWATVETGVVPVGQFTVTDPQSGTNSGRFYRVVAQ